MSPVRKEFEDLKEILEIYVCHVMGCRTGFIVVFLVKSARMA